MKASRAIPALPPRVEDALKKIGEDVSLARRRRRLTMDLVAERALISRNTLRRGEAGDPGVSLGIFATVLFVLGLADRLNGLVDPATDEVGLSLSHELLPRVVQPRRSRDGR